ncbi:enoyl-CoA delta isomerase 3, peroxisomal [Ciona intestinalis]
MTKSKKQEKDEEIFEVEKVINRRKNKGRTFYLVRWKGFSSKDDTWEPTANLKHCKDAIQEYNNDLQKKNLLPSVCISSVSFYNKKVKSKTSDLPQSSSETMKTENLKYLKCSVGQKKKLDGNLIVDDGGNEHVGLDHNYDGRGLATCKPINKQEIIKGRIFQERIVYLQWRENFAEIIFSNSMRRNALSPRFLAELMNALDAVVSSKCSLAVISSVGKTFCAGYDVLYMIDMLSESSHIQQTARNFAECLRNFIDKLIDFPKPLVALVQGGAVGLGCAMLPLVDAVYCSERSYFSTPYIKLGQTPEACSSFTFPQILGMTMANNLLLNGVVLTSHQAKQHGLVTSIFPHDQFKQHAMSCVRRTAMQSSEAMQKSKELLRKSSQTQLKHVNYCECNSLMERWASEQTLINFRSFVSHDFIS